MELKNECGNLFSFHISASYKGGALMPLIGRKAEQELLLDLASSDSSEFVVVYGRRRIGKTYLVRETFPDGFFFSYTGIANTNAKTQLREFAKALSEHGWRGQASANWFDAFSCLRDLISPAAKNPDKIILFLDEMPWMDNKKSDFVPALEHFWNGWASGVKNVMLIVCGSATSWITKKIFRNKGGLYNRVTRQIKLNPFTLAECREFFDSKGIVYNKHDIVESYMIFGGIPYYLNLMNRKFSLALNVDALCFAESAPLRNEFSMLFSSLFPTNSKHKEIVEILSSKKRGLTRDEIAGLVKFPDGGNLTRILEELAESGFIRRYKPFGKSKNGGLHQLTDPFAEFHLEFIRKTDTEDFWSKLADNSRHRAWSGFAFERVCLAHVPQIKKALGISGILSDVASWHSQAGSAVGAQVDLLIDRNDNVIDLCEIKYTSGELVVDKSMDEALRRKADVFKSETNAKKAVHTVLITTYGVKRNSYRNSFQAEVSMDDLLEIK
jgi:AAA+ ATPase superfamily predicted ATPase